MALLDPQRRDGVEGVGLLFKRCGSLAAFAAFVLEANKCHALLNSSQLSDCRHISQERDHSFRRKLTYLTALTSLFSLFANSWRI